MKRHALFGVLLIAACQRSARPEAVHAASTPPGYTAAPGQLDAPNAVDAPKAPDAPAPTRPSAPPPWRCGKTLPSSDFDDSRQARNYGDVENQIQGAHAREVYEWEANGRAMPDRLGRKLPASITRESALTWTEHPHPEAVDLVTARRWPGKAERWVVLTSGKTTDCSDCPPGTTDARIAVVEAASPESGKKARLHRVARTVAALSPRADWNMVPDELRPSGLCDEQGCRYSEQVGLDDRTELAALDFAPYRLTEADRAFGVITYRSEGYSGGGAVFEVLSLFRMEGDRLESILDVPWGVEKMTAGDWNSDQSRQHEWVQAGFAIEVRARPGAIADLTFRSIHARSSAIIFRWNETSSAYGCL